MRMLVQVVVVSERMVLVVVAQRHFWVAMAVTEISSV